MTPTIVGPRYLLPAFPPVAALVSRVPERWFPALAATSAVLMAATALLAFGASGFVLAP